MIGKDDNVIEVRLYTSHDTDYICEREDGSRYVYEVRKDSKTIRELWSDAPPAPEEATGGQSAKPATGPGHGPSEDL